MNSTPELVALIQRERLQSAERGRLARVAACMKSCCSTAPLHRLMLALRLTPSTC